MPRTLPVLPLRNLVVFPGASWQQRTPAEVGMDGATLDLIASDIGGAGVIIKDGYLVKSWGSSSSTGDWASAAA